MRCGSSMVEVSRVWFLLCACMSTNVFLYITCCRVFLVDQEVGKSAVYLSVSTPTITVDSLAEHETNVVKVDYAQSSHTGQYFDFIIYSSCMSNIMNGVKCTTVVC